MRWFSTLQPGFPVPEIWLLIPIHWKPWQGTQSVNTRSEFEGVKGPYLHLFLPVSRFYQFISSVALFLFIFLFPSSSPLPSQLHSPCICEKGPTVPLKDCHLSSWDALEVSHYPEIDFNIFYKAFHEHPLLLYPVASSIFGATTDFLSMYSPYHLSLWLSTMVQSSPHYSSTCPHFLWASVLFSKNDMIILLVFSE